MLESGEEVSYDILVLATGSSGPFPVKFSPSLDTAEATVLYNAMLEKVRAALQTIAICFLRPANEVAGT